MGSGVGVARLVLRSAQREDTGLYTCQASGTFPSSTQPVPTKLIVTREDGYFLSGCLPLGATCLHSSPVTKLIGFEI